MNNNNSERIYFLPVESIGGHYVISQEWQALGLDVIPEVAIKKDLENNHSEEDALVDLHGYIFRAKVYVPRSVEDFSYIAVDSNGDPISHSISTTSIHNSHFQIYVDKVSRKYGLSEGILPEQRSYLNSEYMERVCRIGFPSGERKVADWRAIIKGSRVMLIGQAGGGKTTLLRRIAIGLTENQGALEDSQIPVYIQLRNWHEDRRMSRLAQYELAELIHEDFSSKFSELAVSGRLIYLLDGYDEIASEFRAKALDDIKTFIRNNSTCRFVIATRPGVTPKARDLDFTPCFLEDLSASQVKELCWKKMPHGKRSWQSFWNRLTNEPDVESLSGNPLALTLLIARYSRDSLSPHFVGDALSAVVDAFNDEWDSVRGVRRSTMTMVTPKLQLSLLRHLAASMSSQGMTEVTDSEFSEIMDGMAINDPPKVVIRKLEENTGLIYRTKRETWKFSKAAIQSFLCSSHVSIGDKLIQKNDANTAQMIWRYACWHSNDATDLLKDNVDGPYNADKVISATRALSQNLFVHADLIRAHSLSVIWLLEKICGEIEIFVPFDDKSKLDKTIVFSCKSDKDQNIFILQELLVALHRARDGVSASELLQRVASSAYDVIRSLAVLVNAETHMESNVAIVDRSTNLTIRLTTIGHGQ